MALTYPNKSHRKYCYLPDYSPRLAEFIGVILGDGEISNKYQVTITLNAQTDYYYSQYLITLCNELFGIIPSCKKRSDENSLKLVINRASLVDFLQAQGILIGSKMKNQITIPDWIVNNPEYSRSVVRGLMDTDGCLFLHKKKAKYYIGLCFTNTSTPIIEQVAKILENNKIRPHIPNPCRIYLYRMQAVTDYLSIFRSSNTRLLDIYKAWQ